MFLSSIAIAGGTLITGTTLIGGVSLYRKKKKKKETPWRVYAQKLGVAKEKQKPRLSSRLFDSDIRRQQLKEMTNGTEENVISEAEKKANRKLAISSTALAFATGGALLYPPLNLLSLPFTLIALQPYVVRAYHAVVKERKVGVALMDAIGSAGPLITGHIFIAAFAIHLSNLSRKLLIKTEDHSQKSLTHLFGLQPRFVWVEREGAEVEIPFESLSIGDVVVVDAGQTIPIDGTIKRGVGSIDQRTLTGESQPVEKSIGEPVFASTVLLSGRIGILVEKTGTSTVAAQIGEILNDTADFKSLVQSRGQKIVEQGALPTLAIGLLTLPLLGAESAVAAIGASFGYHMRHAAPIGVLNYLRIASEQGILIKDGRSLELLSEVDTFVFDKTGTLTEEVPTVGMIHTYHRYGENELLTLAAAAEYKQTHPIALAIQQEAANRELTPPAINEAKYEVGYGIKVTIEQTLSSKAEEAPWAHAGQLIRVGSGRFMEMEGIAIGENHKQIEQDCYKEGYSVIYVAIDEQLGGAIELRPTIRPEAKEIINALKRRNMSIAIISGDHEKPTRKLAQELGIEQYFAETLPQNKAQLIEQLQQEGKSVCFVGDGINDSIALKKANVSISLRGASTAATDSASIILMDSSLKQLMSLVELSHGLDRTLKTTTVMTVVPGIICVGGVFFLHLGIMGAVVLYYTALGTSILNAMLPLITHQREKREGQ
ncbi:MAG: heavy metal translocating P-type ATPase [Ardenticatenaceae bacterium]